MYREEEDRILLTVNFNTFDSSIPPILGGTSDATAASTTVGFSQSMSSMQADDKIFIRPTLDNKQYVFYKNLLPHA